MSAFAVILLVIGCVLLGLAIHRERPVAREAWPPISDEEFLRRCSPGVRPEVALGVRRIVSEQLGVDYDRIYPEHYFVRDLGC